MGKKKLFKLGNWFKLERISTDKYSFLSLTTSKKKRGKKRVYTSRRIGGIKYKD